MINSPDMTTAGDADKWIVLRRETQAGMPIIIRVRPNRDIRDYARSNRITAVNCEVEPGLVNEHGMPTCMDALYAFEDRIVALAGDSCELVFHLASATGDGRRTIILAHSSLFDTSEIAANAVCDEARVSVRPIADNDAFEEVFYPTEFDLQMDADRAVLAEINEQGDDGSAERKIEFWFYGLPGGLQELSDMLAPSGFCFERWTDENRSGLVLALMTPATQAHFAALNEVIIQATEGTGVTYDGWETPVIL